jgi:hypothetical protein
MLKFFNKVEVFFNGVLQDRRKEKNYLPHKKLYTKKISLEQKHIDHLKVLLDRRKLFELFPKNGIVAELGVAEGGNAKKILEITKPKKLFLVDKWPLDVSKTRELNALGKSASLELSNKKFNSVKEKFQDEIASEKVVIVRRESVKAMKTFPDNYFDWVYIDTTHTYEQTLKELEICRLKVKKNGIISGHDYCHGITYPFWVIQAVQEFCIKHKWEIIYLTQEYDGFFSFALREIKK